MLLCRGIRGAILVEANEKEAILEATQALLAWIVEANGIERETLASVIFSVTPDLDAEFPALAARRMGWRDVPLLCSREIAVPGAMPRVVRVLVHWNTARAASEIRHAYLRDAAKLRPDLALRPSDEAPQP